MKVVYLSDQVYFHDQASRWYTTASFPLTTLAKAFPLELSRWVFFGRILPAPLDVSPLYPIENPPGISVEYHGPRNNFEGITGYLRALPQYFFSIKRCIRDADLVWAKLPFVASWLALLRRPRRGYYVTHMVGDPGDSLERRGGWLWRRAANLSRVLSRKAMENANFCLFVSNDLRRRYAPEGKETGIVHEGRVSKDDLADGFQKKGRKVPSLMYIGRLSPEKGVDVLIRAIALSRESADLHLRVVGSGPEKDRLLSLVSSLGLSDSVHFAGTVRWGPSLFAEIRAATCLVLPSYTEGFGLVVLEGLSQATPVVISEVCGVRELVQSGRSAILVPAGNVTALSVAILQVVLDTKLQEQLAQEGLKVAAANTLERQVELLRPVFAMASPGT